MQIARAFFAAIAAIMITFSSDHSAPVGLSVLGGFLVANALVHILAAWLVYPAGQRLPSILLGALSFAAAAAATVAGRTTIVFFVVLIAWAATTGIVELAFGLAGRRRGRIGARDEILIGAVTILLAIGVLLVSPQYVLDYTIKETGGTGVLTGITIAVGLYGGYAAIVAVFLGIAAVSPRRPAPREDATPTDAPDTATDEAVSGSDAPVSDATSSGGTA